ncbi:Z1 domain-containing protein [Gracilibacillus alcaliphilus]|uniref:Z1 domain-containing protein n=1 Tax=Gracilibacillus alcaliphilus TaxID=1401441 RepID=UPI00195782FA|nr:Z1 domain-containing protein [Gracilibacillus alcaliphilus]MBM7679595.1 signal peptidase I [Gracilibacillus alcaliphilus]
MEIPQLKRDRIVQYLQKLTNDEMDKEEKIDWDYIKHLKHPEIPLKLHLNILGTSSTLEEGTSEEEYLYVFEEFKELNQLKKAKFISTTSAGLAAENSINDLKLEDRSGSNWRKYKLHLEQNNGWSDKSIAELSRATEWILQQLNLKNNSFEDIRKGLVLGNVQSGKTASMAGLMAAASDHGFNFFIIVSGMMDNLKSQTEDRLLNDLNSNERIQGSNWTNIKNIHNKNRSHHLSELDVSDRITNNNIYFTVLLKNVSHLKGLITWLKKDEERLGKLKVLIIDDESDQAGINTKEMSTKSDQKEFDRSTINKNLINIVHLEHNGKSYGAMNYVAYTATPYANILNENEPESLFPHHFIYSLKPSPLYIGPKQIYGIPADTDKDQSLDIINLIDDDDLIELRSVQACYKLPYTLEKALIWFQIGLAILRTHDFKKPLSMLIHTSQKINDHEAIKYLIEKWFTDTSKEQFLKKCESVFIEEKNRVTAETFLDILPDYELDIKVNPSIIEFNEIKPELEYIYDKSIDTIKLFGEDKVFSESMHLCVDNSKNNTVIDNKSYRLAYPNKQQLADMKKAPGFIVIGGSTLSRGLTLEGLISTYFIRTTKIADTLMQMGRWFGYRIGYELLPRIWMSSISLERFRFLVEIDEDLRESIKEFAKLNKTPREYGIKVINSPDNRFMQITGANRAQSAKEAEIDFTGYKPQDINFTNNKEKLKQNIQLTEAFLSNLGNSENNFNNNGVFWRGITISQIFDNYLLKGFYFNKRTAAFNNLESIKDWCSLNKFNTWNVAVAGKIKQADTAETWKVDNKYLTKANRSVKGDIIKDENGQEIVSIGVLRNPNDYIIDFDSKPQLADKNLSNEKIRNHSAQKETPLLVIYRLNKYYEPANSNNRQSLNFDEDIIGISLIIPGDNAVPRGKYLTINPVHVIDDLEGEE